MSSLIKHPKDFYAGLMYAAVGAGAVLIARGYNLGTSVRMGPGYFPTVLGGLLILVGMVSMIRAFLHEGDAIKSFAWKEIFLLLGSVILFGLIVRGAGLLISLILLVLVSAWASDKFKWKTAALLAILTSVFSGLVFVKGLGLPFAIIGPWFAR
jgi:hypothetical protein